METKKCIVGIDPGFNGAIAFLYSDGTLFLEKMPVKIATQKELDFKRLRALLSAHSIKFVALEKAFLLPEQDLGRGSRYLYFAGAVYGLCLGLGIPVLHVQAAVWKSALNLNSDKRGSLRLARSLFPEQAGEFKKLKDDGKAEAALIAHFARRLVK